MATHNRTHNGCSGAIHCIAAQCIFASWKHRELAYSSRRSIVRAGHASTGPVWRSATARMRSACIPGTSTASQRVRVSAVLSGSARSAWTSSTRKRAIGSRISSRGRRASPCRRSDRPRGDQRPPGSAHPAAHLFPGNCRGYRSEPITDRESRANGRNLTLDYQVEFLRRPLSRRFHREFV